MLSSSTATMPVMFDTSKMEKRNSTSSTLPLFDCDESSWGEISVDVVHAFNTRSPSTSMKADKSTKSSSSIDSHSCKKHDLDISNSSWGELSLDVLDVHSDLLQVDDGEEEEGNFIRRRYRHSATKPARRHTTTKLQEITLRTLPASGPSTRRVSRRDLNDSCEMAVCLQNLYMDYGQKIKLPCRPAPSLKRHTTC
jgi:hypothetical protein